MLELYAADVVPPRAACLLFQPRTLHVSARVWHSPGRTMSFLRVDGRLDPVDYVGHAAHEPITRFRTALASFPIWLNDGDPSEPPRPWACGSLVMAREKSFCLLSRALADPQVARLAPFFAAAGERLSVIFTAVPIAQTDDEVKFALVDFEVGTQQSRVG